MSGKKEAPESLAAEGAQGVTDGDQDSTAENAGGQESKKHGGYFPVGKLDFKKINETYPNHSPRLCQIWCVLLKTANDKRSHKFKMTSQQLASKCACSKRTIDYRLKELRALDLIETKSGWNAETGKREVKEFKISPDVSVCNTLHTAQPIAHGNPCATDGGGSVAQLNNLSSSQKKTQGIKKETPASDESAGALEAPPSSGGVSFWEGVQ
ncbi:hypothetical protein EGM51_04065 [Verrucomicrobia bacterium S94]|nr:hypothetical protein EGM51_04065 [Verrucomicrobia bacterium S94]